MKKSIVTILLGVFLSLLSGCGDKSFNLPSLSMPDVSIPAFDLSPRHQDPNLPRVNKLRSTNTLSEVALEWEPIKDRRISGYRIYRNDGEGNYKAIKIINDRYVSHFTDENKEQSRYNRYQIAAFTERGHESIPTSFPALKKHKKIAPVTIISVLSGLPNRVKVLWRIHPDPRIVSYLVQRRDNNTGEWQNLAMVDRRLSVEYIDTTTIPGHTYYYRVAGKTADGIYSMVSAPKSGTPKALPAPITNIQATTNLPKKIELIWTPSALKNALYRIYASDFKDGIYGRIAETKSTHFIDRFDKDGIVRFYRVTVIDSDGLESSQQVHVAKGMTLGYLNAPNITAARVVNSTVELQWTQTDPRTVSYTIYKKYWNGWRPKIIKTVGFTGTTFIDRKIAPNITYTYYVVGMDKSGIPSSPSRSVNLAIESMPKTSTNGSWF